MPDSSTMISGMMKETVTQVSSAVFAKDPQRYLDKVQAGHVVEVSSTHPRTETFVIISKEDLEGLRATAELLAHPEDRAAILKSLSELAGRE
jgi:prevent-host-death family protein